jgi:hypothetical protein
MTQWNGFSYYRRMAIDGQMHEQEVILAFIVRGK